MKYIVTVNGNRYEVEIEAEHSEVAVSNNNAAIEEVKEPSAPAPIVPQNVEGEVISAPMPGKILAVKVSNGQTVKKGDLLFVLEAMKMENEIMAPKSGVISGVFVQKDANVNPGDKLASIS